MEDAVLSWDKPDKANFIAKSPTCTHVGDHRCIQVEHAATMSTCMCKGDSFTLKPSAGRGTSAVFMSDLACGACINFVVWFLMSGLACRACISLTWKQTSQLYILLSVTRSLPCHVAVRLIGTGAYYSTFMVVIIVNAFYTWELKLCFVMWTQKFFNLLLLEKHMPLEEMKVHVSMAFPINTLTILFLFNTTFYNSIKYAYKSSIQWECATSV